MTLVAKIIGEKPNSCELVTKQWKLKCFHAFFFLRLILMCWTSTSNEIVGTVQ